MPKILDAPGDAKPVSFLLRGLAERLGITDFWPWESDAGPIDAILDHPSTGRATVAHLASEGGIRALAVSPVAHPDRTFTTPSRKIEFFSERAASLGFPPLPVHDDLPVSPYALTLRTGPYAHALPRLLRPRPRAADAGEGGPGAGAVDSACGRGCTRDRGWGADPHPQRARRHDGTGPRDRPYPAPAPSGCATDGKVSIG